jgi:hypothetical protein
MEMVLMVNLNIERERKACSLAAATNSENYKYFGLELVPQLFTIRERGKIYSITL